MNEADASLVGKIAGEYRIVQRVGTGTMGHVYEAEHMTRGGRVALKVLHKQHKGEIAARFLREGKTLKLLSHPRIVELVDMGQLDNGALYLATELIRGQSLRDVMNQGAIEPRRALAIVRQILDALDAAHELGVVHRDIKPENIMVGEQDAVKVLDFGVAKLLSDSVAGLGEANLTSVGFSIFGSAWYIAPESVVGAPVDARIDLYSVGAMLYEMLTGKPPYDAEDPTEILKQHAFAAIPTLASAGKTFTPEIEQLVARALAKQPDQRYRNATEMMAAVDHAILSLSPPRKDTTPKPTDRPLVWPVAQQHKPTQPVARPWLRWMSPMQWLLVGGALAVIVLAVLVVAKAKRTQEPTAPGAVGDASSAKKLLEQGHAKFGIGHRLEALGAFEQALHTAPQLADNPELRADLVSALDSKDSLVPVVALELLAMVTPPAHDAIATYAASGRVPEARHRAILLAERDGYANKIDRIESWLLDLAQAGSCEEKKVIIEKLGDAKDKRALGPLKKAKAAKCTEAAAGDAIAKIDPTSQGSGQ